MLAALVFTPARIHPFTEEKDLHAMLLKRKVSGIGADITDGDTRENVARIQYLTGGIGRQIVELCEAGHVDIPHEARLLQQLVECDALRSIFLQLTLDSPDDDNSFKVGLCGCVICQFPAALSSVHE